MISGPSVPSEIFWNTYDPYSLNMSWEDSVVNNQRDSAQNTLFSTLFQYWFEIEYSYTNSTGSFIQSGVLNTTSLYTHEVTGLPGPSESLDVKLISVIDCQNHQGRIDSYTSIGVDPKTSACTNSDTFQTNSVKWKLMYRDNTCIILIFLKIACPRWILFSWVLAINLWDYGKIHVETCHTKICRLVHSIEFLNENQYFQNKKIQYIAKKVKHTCNRTLTVPLVFKSFCFFLFQF